MSIYTPFNRQSAEFTAFPTLNADLKAAVFEVDAAHINEKDVAQYFSDEQIEVPKYNNRRARLLVRATELNSAIEEWNKKSRVLWESFMAECKQMAVRTSRFPGGFGPLYEVLQRRRNISNGYWKVTRKETSKVLLHGWTMWSTKLSSPNQSRTLGTWILTRSSRSR